METGSVVGTVIGWSVVAILVIGYFASVLRTHWREQERKKHDGSSS